MATSRVVPMKMTQMKVAQVSKPGADFEIVEREFLRRMQDTFGSKCRLAVCATVTCSRKKAYGPEFRSPNSRTRSRRNHR